MKYMAIQTAGNDTTNLPTKNHIVDVVKKEKCCCQ